MRRTITTIILAMKIRRSMYHRVGRQLSGMSETNKRELAASIGTLQITLLMCIPSLVAAIMYILLTI